jgi:hypothetical protein
MIDLNPGDRASRLELDRLATGELTADEAARVTDRLTPDGRAHLEAVRNLNLPPLDVAAVRRRAAALPADPVVAPPAVPVAANTTWAYVGVFLTLAAALLVVARLAWTEAPSGGGDVRFRAGDALEVVQLVGGAPRDYAAGTPVGEGDVLGFRVQATGHEAVVLLSVDGRGQATVFWPESGEAAEPLSGDGLVALQGSVVLDDAPGPEVFVAVYDQDVPAALRLVSDAWADGGAPAVLAVADAEPGVHAIEVTRR